MNNKNLLTLLAAGGVTIIFAWSLIEFFRDDTLTLSRQEAYTSQTQGGIPEKCKVQEGYTEEEWKEHMSHHPDIYAECL